MHCITHKKAEIDAHSTGCELGICKYQLPVTLNSVREMEGLDA